MVVVALLLIGGVVSASQELVAGLRQLGAAVDNMSANISKAESDTYTELLAKVTRQALDQGLKQDRPTIDIKASRGYCRVTIETLQWKLWSEAREGKIVDHGAKIH